MLAVFGAPASNEHQQSASNRAKWCEEKKPERQGIRDVCGMLVFRHHQHTRRYIFHVSLLVVSKSLD